MRRKIMEPVEIQQLSEEIVDRLKGMPVAHALDVLKTAQRNMLWLATVSKPEEIMMKDVSGQLDIEEFIKNFIGRKEPPAPKAA